MVDYDIFGFNNRILGETDSSNSGYMKTEGVFFIRERHCGTRCSPSKVLDTDI